MRQRLIAAALGSALIGWSPSASAQECATDADCTEGSCVDAVCRVEVGERVEVPPELGDRYVLETRRYWPLLIAGGALFGAAWIGTIAAVGATAEDADRGSAIGQAFVPAAGPVLLHASGKAPEDVKGLLIGMGALQGLGLLTAFVGLTVESKVLMPAGEMGASLVVTPLVGGGPLGGGVTGVGVGGRF
jgi:hypothetical protein